MKYFMWEIWGWVKYFFTRKKYKIVIEPKAKEFLDSLPPEERDVLEKAIESLAKNPFQGRPVKEKNETNKEGT